MNILEHIFNCYMVEVSLSPVKNRIEANPNVIQQSLEPTNLNKIIWYHDTSAGSFF